MNLGKKLGAGLAAIGSLLLVAAPAGATTATATVNAGSLGFASTPGNVTFPSVTLNGQNKTIQATQPLDIADATGSGAGWNITATSTLFTSGSNTLPNGVFTSNPGSPTCDANVTCTPAGVSSVAYPYFMPAGKTAPTATKMFSAPAGTGMGDQTLTPTWNLFVPGNAYAGNYSSTWTLSLVSGP